MKQRTLAAGASALALLTITMPAMAKDYFLASGRWDNVVLVIDLEKALDRANDATPNAIINRLRVTPDIDGNGTGKLDTIASGQPIIITIEPDQMKAYVVNHSGRSKPEDAKAFQHGHPGTVTVLDMSKALDPRMDGTLGAVAAIIDTGGFGPTGFAITPDGKYGALAHAEDKGNEDGGRHITMVDLATNEIMHRVEQAYGKPGFDCPPDPIPHKAPDMKFGCFPDANGVTVSALGGGLIFTANGGTDDVSVIDIGLAVAGKPGAEKARIPMQTGGFGVATSPDGKLIAHASREDARTGKEGNTVSIVDVEKVTINAEKAEVARILVGRTTQILRPVPSLRPSRRTVSGSSPRNFGPITSTSSM
jgi:DNA-binding beta-propeller fold protein YncE